MLKIAIIILNWENAPATLECARSVLDEMERSFNIVNSQLWIVDNGSCERSVDALKTWIDQVGDEKAQLILNPENLGFSAGMNKGVFAALETGGFDYFWLLNNDLTLEPGALSTLAQSALEDPAVAIWGPTVVDANTTRVQCAGGCQYNRWIGKETRVYTGKNTSGLAELARPELDYIYGAAMLVRGDVLTRLHGLNEDYFLFYEELDLVKQLQKTDKLSWCIASKVQHKGGASSVTKADKVFAAYHAALSAFKYTRRYHPLCLPTVVVSRILGLTVYAVRYLNPGLAFAPLRALRDFVRTEP